jgi:hypothetical protein
LIIDLLVSKDGLRLDEVDVTLTGVRVVRTPDGYAAQTADRLTGRLRLQFVDLAAALVRPELFDQLLGGVTGLAKPDVALVNGEDGGVRLVGSIEALGMRIPIRASTRVHVANNRLILTATQLEGLPMLRAIPLQLVDLVLPLAMPAGLTLTGVSTETGCFVLAFEGTDVPLRRPSGTSA